MNFVIATGGGEKMHGSSLDDVDRHTRFREEASHQPPHNQRPVWNIFDHDPAVFFRRRRFSGVPTTVVYIPSPATVSVETPRRTTEPTSLAEKLLLYDANDWATPST